MVSHSDASELAWRQTSGQTLSMTHDAAGNRRTQEIDVNGQTVTITYTWDAWNRLVGVAYGSQERSEYHCNAVNWPPEKVPEKSHQAGGNVGDAERRAEPGAADVLLGSVATSGGTH